MLKFCHRSYATIQHCSKCLPSNMTQCRRNIYLLSSSSCFHLDKRLQTHGNYNCHNISTILAPNKKQSFQHINVQTYASKRRGRKSKAVFGEDDQEVFSDDEDEGKEKDENLSDDELKDKDEAGTKTWKDLSVNTASLRIDAILSSGLGISRKKIEDAFLDARLMLNNKVISKKSKTLKPGDVVDVVLKEKGDQEKEVPSTAVMRVKVLNIREEPTSKGRIPVKLRRWKYLKIEEVPQD